MITIIFFLRARCKTGYLLSSRDIVEKLSSCHLVLIVWQGKQELNK